MLFLLIFQSTKANLTLMVIQSELTKENLTLTVRQSDLTKAVLTQDSELGFRRITFTHLTSFPF